MKFPIQSKLTAGITFLFLVILIMGIISLVFIHRMSADSEAILTNNYSSLQYCNGMLEDLDAAGQGGASLRHFEGLLVQQEKNITEPGELAATGQLRVLFEQIRKSPGDTTYYDDARKKIYYITDLNEKAIQKKNLLAQQTSRNATTWLATIGTLFTLIAFSFLFNFPRIIASPIRTLAEGIREITNKNYEKRIYFQSSDEFAELAEAFNQMASRLDEYEHSSLAKLMLEKKRIETIIGQMNDAIIGLDAQHHILFINSIAEDLLHLKAEQVVGAYAPDIALKNDLFRKLLLQEENSGLLKIVLEGKENFFTKDHKNVMNQEEVIGEVIVLRNITAFKELDISKTNFIATISHELKTPISSIKMSLKLLQDKRIGPLNEEQTQLLDNILDDAGRLLKITGELLDLTQIESGKINLQKEKIAPGALMEVAVEANEMQARQKQVSLNIQQAEGLPELMADAEKTSWVLINLIANAIQYSSENQEVIIRAGQQDDHMVFSVQDFGRGIDPKYQEALFHRYFRVPGSTSPTGSGLGLAICKEFMEAQGGSITVKSEPGKGSTFTVRLPLA